MSDLCLQNKAHAVCSELFLRVTPLCEIFAYKTRYTPCVVSCFFRVAELCQIFAYRTWHTLSVANCFFGSLSYVRSSLTKQGTRGVYWVVSSGRSVISDLRLQNKAQAMFGELFFRVAQLCVILAYRARRTSCIVSCFFGSLSYVWFSLIERGTHRV